MNRSCVRTGVGIALWALLAGPQAQTSGWTQEASPDPEIRRLVEQLDADDLAQREQARDLLLKKGRSIAPVLRPLLNSPSAEVASQVRGILERLEWEENLEHSLPSRYRVTIPKKPRSLEEFLREIESQAGFRIVPCALPLRQNLDLGWENAPVLGVLDDLCRALGRGRPELPPLALGNYDGSDPFERHRPTPGGERDLVIDGEKTMPFATAHGGPIRVALTDVVITETASFRAQAAQGELHLQVGAVPGTRPITVGWWQVQEIVDDKGASLKLEDPARPFFGGESEAPEGEQPDAIWFSGSRWFSMDQKLDSIAFAAPAAGARRLSLIRLKIRMTFPVKQVTRQLSLAEIKAKGTFDFGTAGVETTAVDLKENVFSLGFRMKGVVRGTPKFALLDQEGREIHTNGGGMSSSGNHYDQRWYLRGGEPVAAVQVKGWRGVKTLEIPIEFNDVPLPAEK